MNLDLLILFVTNLMNLYMYRKNMIFIKNIEFKWIQCRNSHNRERWKLTLIGRCSSLHADSLFDQIFKKSKYLFYNVKVFDETFKFKRRNWFCVIFFSLIKAGQGSKPEWNEKFTFKIEYPSVDGQYKLILKLMDHDTFSSDDYLGEATWVNFISWNSNID